MSRAVMDDAKGWIWALKKCLPEAEQYLDVRPLLSDLRAKGILTAFEYADVTKDGINAIERTRLVFQAAERKDTQYIKTFVEILDVPGSRKWADMIRREAEAFYQPLHAADQKGACPTVIQTDLVAAIFLTFLTLPFSMNTTEVANCKSY